jgi:hypothetical protein
VTVARSVGRARILYVTDLDYPARGRAYGDEDRFVTAQLGDRFDITVCHPTEAEARMAGFDAVVVRNSGPVLRYQAAYDSFRVAAIASGARVYNELTGRADMIGKQYLVDLTMVGAAVIPTVDRPDDVDRLPVATRYVVKPKLGSDSIGMRMLGRDEIDGTDLSGMIVQPAVDFVHEVSFVFVDDALQYALVAPDPERRWELRPFDPSPDDARFAQWFVRWNAIRHGIQRVDACRTADGRLLLMELEDLNPYLSLDVVDASVRDRFITAMGDAIDRLIRSH